MVVHSTLKDLASGFVKVAGKELKDVRDVLVKAGRDQAIEIACKAIEKRTGLPNAICNRAGEIVVDTLSKEIKELIKR